MKLIKRLLIPILLIALLSGAFLEKTYAGNEPHLSLKVLSSEIKAGETFSVVVQNKEMNVLTFIGSIIFEPELLELVSTTTFGFELENGQHANVNVEVNEENGVVGLIVIGTQEKKYKGSTDVVELTFRAKKAGTANLYISESSDGPDGCNAESILAFSIEIGENNSADANNNSETTNPDSEKKIKEIKITTPPTKTEYVTGESFDSTGMVVEIVYEDGSVKVADDYEIDQIVVDKKINQVKITYGDVSTTQKIKVIGNEVEKKNITWLIIIIASLTLIVIFLIIYLQKTKRSTKKKDIK